METYADDKSVESVERSLKFKENQDVAAVPQSSSQQETKEGTFLSDENKEKAHDSFTDLLVYLSYFSVRFPSIFSLLLLMSFSGVLYLFFRHCPNIPDLRFSEFFVSMVYANNMYSIYCIIFGFFRLSTLVSLSFLLVLIPLKQLSGYSWIRIILKICAAFLLMVLLVVAILYIVYFLIMGYVALRY